MLIKFSVKNWMCFQDEIEFSMIASLIRKPYHMINNFRRFHMRVLPVATIYGANAAGKTAMIKAIDFARYLITSELVSRKYSNGIKGLKKYRLNSKSSSMPTKFSFTLLLGEDAKIVYYYEFTLSDNEVLYEQLSKYDSKNEIVLYTRIGNNIEFTSDVDDFFLYAKSGTKPNQLFLNNVISQSSENDTLTLDYKNVYNWFDEQLIIIYPDSKYGGIERLFYDNDEFTKEISRSLSRLDTGIRKLSNESINISKLGIPDDLMNTIIEEVNDIVGVRISDNHGGHIVFSKDDDGNLIAEKLVSIHQSDDGNQVNIDISDESDGTRRLIDLLPVFIKMSKDKSNITCFIDELDRSLHTLVTAMLLKAFLHSRNDDNRSQLIFTTHDITLIEAELFRLDEIWLLEKNYEGNSQLVSMYDYKLSSKEKNLKKAYLSGKMGGIPRVVDLL